MRARMGIFPVTVRNVRLYRLPRILGMRIAVHFSREIWMNAFCVIFLRSKPTFWDIFPRGGNHN
ncbi:hypothetical protein CLV97_101229 [Planifilum fimeticola]|jgi:hypothetical protein|uniref:Uncharacterized protein n=1 Tax=Planifilum fimeticola TaxID=201975 RepID=A0A2T0LJM6_9BACL|nr:hypothetical protein CLV97_101229 [Planifilum fimeticola]